MAPACCGKANKGTFNFAARGEVSPAGLYAAAVDVFGPQDFGGAAQQCENS
jgi:hypothetical protein